MLYTAKGEPLSTAERHRALKDSADALLDRGTHGIARQALKRAHRQQKRIEHLHALASAPPAVRAKSPTPDQAPSEGMR